MDQKDKRLHYILPKRNSNSHDGETSYVPNGRWTDKENVMFSWNEILSHHKMEWNPAIFYDIDGLWVYYAKWNKLEKDTYYITHLNMDYSRNADVLQKAFVWINQNNKIPRPRKMFILLGRWGWLHGTVARNPQMRAEWRSTALAPSFPEQSCSVWATATV